MFSTGFDFQNSIEIHLLQGEGETIGQNRSLGRFSFNIAPLRPKAEPQIEITFSIDASGRMTVSAVNLETQITKQFHQITLDIY